jgi:hypothetical protein
LSNYTAYAYSDRYSALPDSLRSTGPVWECKGGPTGSPLAPPLALAARFILRPRDPVERLVRDGMLSEKEAQLGRVFLHVAHIVQLEL